MVEMRDVQIDAELAAQCDQRVEQAQRIGAAGYADDERFAAREQIMPQDGAANLRQDIHRPKL